MKRRIFCCLAVCALLAAPAVLAQPRVGMTDTTAYFPLLEGRRVAVLANQTSVADMPGAPGADASGRVHLVDLLQFCFIILFCTKLSPENFFQFIYIFFCKWLILFQL